MKKGLKFKHKFIFFILLVFFTLFISLVLAAHVITFSDGTTSFNVDENIVNLFNITVNNSDTGQVANITQVNISLFGNFLFMVNTNTTDAGNHLFTNTSTVLSWVNMSYFVVNGSTIKNFWFNATADTPGVFNISVTTANVTGAFTTNISITVNDTTPPSSIEFVSPTENNNSNLSQSDILINATATDNGVIDTIIARLFNSTNDQINLSTSSTSPLFINFSGLSEGIYYFNASVNDTYGNSNSTSTRTIILDTTNPVVTLIGPPDSNSSTTTAYNFTFNVTDTNLILNCSLIFDGSILNTLTSLNNTGGTNGIDSASLSVATHTWSINCTDIAENTGKSSARTLIITSSSTSSSTSTSSTTITSFWTRTYILNDNQLKEGYSKDLAIKNRVKLTINNETHYIGVSELTTASAIVTIQSTPKNTTFNIGDEKKFDLTNDNYYDVNVKLNSIANSEANLTIKSIHEEVKQEVVEETTKAEETTANETPPETITKKSLLWLWILIIVIVILLIIAAIFYFFYYKKGSFKTKSSKKRR